jgi:hypothetical protein
MKIEQKRASASQRTEGVLASRKRDSTGTSALVWYFALATVPLLDFLLDVGPPYPWGTPLITSLVAFAAAFGVFRGVIPRKRIPLTMLVFGISVLVYASLEIGFIGERTYENGRKGRVVLGYSLRPELEKAIQEASRNGAPEDIRQTAIDAVAANTDNPATPYSRSSRAVVAGVLLLSWETVFAALAGLAILMAGMAPTPPRNQRGAFHNNSASERRT